MAQDLLNLLHRLIDNPLIIGAFGTAFLIPVLNFTSKWLDRRHARVPAAPSANALPDHPMLISVKVALKEEEWARLESLVGRMVDDNATSQEISALEERMRLIQTELIVLKDRVPRARAADG